MMASRTKWVRTFFWLTGTLPGFALVFFNVESASAWARRGHSLIAQAAAYNLADENVGLKERSFDLEYYSNTPDFIWKDDDKVKSIERTEHFMNLEVFQRETKSKKVPFEADRIAFFKKYPSIPVTAGRAYWRVAELSDDFASVTKDLRASDQSDIKKHHELQAKWFLLAGIIGHYIGDLSMPLHVSENYDGAMTKQNGIHRYFEGDSVDQIFPEIAGEVIRRTKAQWNQFHSAHKDKSAFDMAIELGEDSFAKKNELLELDKIKGRNLKNASAQYRTLILERLTKSALFLSEIWSRNLGWKFNTDKFFIFTEKPEYIWPKEEIRSQ
jgi:hypothetical protein